MEYKVGMLIKIGNVGGLEAMRFNGKRSRIVYITDTHILTRTHGLKTGHEGVSYAKYKAVVGNTEHWWLEILVDNFGVLNSDSLEDNIIF